MINQGGHKNAAFFNALSVPSITSLASKFRKIDTQKVIDDCLHETTADFENIQRDQLLSGKANTGKEIAPRYRRRKYADAKHDMNPLPGYGIPDLKLTGSFHRGIDVKAGRESFNIISTDKKAIELEQKYSDIFGLGGKFKSEYIKENLAPALKKKISKFTGLKFQ